MFQLLQAYSERKSAQRQTWSLPTFHLRLPVDRGGECLLGREHDASVSAPLVPALSGCGAERRCTNQIPAKEAGGKVRWHISICNSSPCTWGRAWASMPVEISMPVA